MNRNMLSAYLAGNEQVNSWFGGPWSTLEALENWPGSSHKWPREKLYKILSEQASKYNSSPATQQHIKLLKKNDCMAIICGQQPALGGGPLYTLIKAAQAIVSCQRLRQLQMTVVPIFWCASEDHDEGECNHADLISRDGQVQRVVSAFDQPGASLHFQSASTWWPLLLDHLDKLFGKSLGRSWFLKLKPCDDESTSAWTCRFLSQIFAEHGLVCIQAHHLRPLWQDKVIPLIDHWPSLALANRRKEIMDAGFSDSFNGHLKTPPLFLDLKTGRNAIPDLDARQKHSWEKNLNVSEHHISSGAALRPIIQQMCLPGLGFIGGPGELHYHAFLGPIYQEFNVPLPRFIPRQHMSLIPPWLARQIEAWGVQAQDINVDSPIPPLSSSEAEAQLILQHSKSIEEELRKLKALSISDADLKRRQHGGVQSLESALRSLQDSLARRERSKRRLPPFGHIKDFLFPRKTAHERIMSCSQATWLYGPGIGNALVKALHSAKPGKNQQLYL